MSGDTTDVLKSIDNRLKWLLKLRVEEQFDEDATNKEKVELLYQMGFENGEMAEIVGTSKSSISGTVTHLRNEGKIE